MDGGGDGGGGDGGGYRNKISLGFLVPLFFFDN